MFPTIRNVAFCALLGSLLGESGAAAWGQVTIQAPAAPEVAGLVPGTSRRAEVELRIGEAVAQPLPHRLLYRAPSSLDGASHLLIEYYPDQRVARIDVELAQPLDPAAMVARVGNRVHQDQDEKGRLVEYFFPSLLGLVHAGDSAGSPVTAVAYLSPQRMADVFCERANDDIKTERFDAALTECDKAVLVSPEYARGYRCRAVALSRTGQSEAALQQRLAATHAAFGARYKMLASSEIAEEFFERGWKDRAFQALADARQADPSSPVPFLTEAKLRNADKQLDQSAAAFKEAAKRAGEDDSALARAADGLYELKRYVDAAEYYQRLAARSYGDPFSVGFRAGYCLSEASRHAEAIPHYEKALELKPADLWANNNVGHSYLKTGRPDVALRFFEKAIAIAPQELLPVRNRIYALIALGSSKLARDLVKELQRLHPDNRLLIVQMAESYGAEGKYSAALEWLERAAKAGFRDCEFLRSSDHLQGVRDNKSKEFERLCSVK